MENSIRIIRAIEKTHKGLGIPLLFGNLCNLADVSCFFIGEMGAGKGTIINSIKGLDVQLEHDMNLYSINLTTLIKTIGDLKDTKMIWRIPEWSTLLPYHRNVFLTIGSQIISDHNFNHISRTSDDKVIGIKIQNVILCAFVGIQPLKLSRMMGENENWESISKDRFMKFAMINPLREDTIESKPEYSFVPELGIHDVVTIQSELQIMKWTLQDQSSEERLVTYCRRLIKAYAKLEGYEIVTAKVEVEFNKLFSTYMKLFSLMSYTTDIDKEDRFAVGTLRLLTLIVKHNPLLLHDVLEKFKYKDIENESFRREVILKAEMLERAKLITIKNSEPTFSMSNDLEKFYQWYQEISK